MPTQNRIAEERTVVSESGNRNRVFTFKATQVVWLIFGLIEGLIAIRIGLKLIAANPNTPIVTFIYAITDVFLWPFQGITISPTVGNVVLELPSIIALVIYALIAWALERLIWVVFYRPRTHVEEITETTTSDDQNI